MDNKNNKEISHLERYKEKREPPRGTQSIYKAARLLYAVGRHDENGIRLSQIARELGLHVATAKRIMTVLAEEHLLSYDPLTKLYRLGYGLYSLAQHGHQFDLADQLRDTLVKIAVETGDSVFLIIRNGLDVVCIEHISGNYPIRASTMTVGTRRPMGIGASSIAMLAKMPAKQANRIISANHERYREFGNLTDEKIKRLVQDAGERGYAVFDRRAGMIFTAVGLAVINRRNEIVAGLGVSAIHSRMNAERRESVVTVMRAALEEVHYGF